MLREQLASIISTAYSMADVSKIVAKTDRSFAVRLVNLTRRQLHQKLEAIGEAAGLTRGDMLWVAASSAIDSALGDALAALKPRK